MRAKALIGALAATALLAGCGGDDGDEAEDLLLATLTKDSPDIQSANTATEISGSLGGEQGGDFSLSFDGPIEFASEEGGTGSLDWTVTAQANTPLLGSVLGTDDVDFEGGITVVDEKLFVTYQDTAYEADQGLYSQLAPGLQGSIGPTATSGVPEEQAQELIDSFSEFSDEGTEDVGGEETTHLSGQLDADSLSNLSEEGENPVGIEGIDSVDFDIWIADDEIARKVEVGASLELPQEATTFIGIDSVDFSFSSEITDLNEADEIAAPEDAKPISGLFDELGFDPSNLQLPGLGGVSSPDTESGSAGGDSALQGCIAAAETDEELSNCLQQ